MLWVFLVYLAILLVLGFIAERYTKGLEGFLLGFPGRGFSRGRGAIWVGVACIVGDSLNCLLVSKRLRDETARLRALTIPEYLERRFAKQGGHAIQVVASLALSFFMLIYLWAQFVAAGKALMAGDVAGLREGIRVCEPPRSRYRRTVPCRVRRNDRIAVRPGCRPRVSRLESPPVWGRTRRSKEVFPHPY